MIAAILTHQAAGKKLLLQISAACSQVLFMMEMLVLCHCKCGIVFVITKRQKWKVEVTLQNH